MSGIEINNVSKRFGAVEVLSKLSLSIAEGEFIAFLGPSGCGKTTLLRLIAGLERLDEGEILLGDQRIDQLAPGARGVAMVFQHYALYPQMTARDNMAFGLRNIDVPKAEIEKRIADAAKSLEIEALLERKPGQLSGGQRQRVAIGRALVKKPSAYLFDEPLSNLDAALRVRTRVELARLHQQTKATTIFVTHDQVEAMTMAQRIVVMNARKIEQVGTPMEVYSRPASEFVARFVGSPAMNFLPAQISSGSKLAVVTLADGSKHQTAVPAASLPKDGALRLGIRAEAVRPDPKGNIKGQVDVVERLGDRTHLHVRLADGTSITAEDKGTSKVKPGDAVALSFDAHESHIFDASGTSYLAAGDAA